MSKFDCTLWDYHNPIDLGVIEVDYLEDLNEVTTKRIISIYGSESEFVEQYNTLYNKTFTSILEIIKYSADYTPIRQEN